jgi:AhpD family alkylhydroperoxidase
MSHERRIPPDVRVTASLRHALEEWQASVVVLDRMDPVTTELVRLRAAAYHDCRTCKSLRTTTGRDAGVDEAMTAKIDRYETSDLPERQKVALRFADAIMTQPGEISIELNRQLHQHFTDAELLELSLDVMKWNYQKVPVALRTDAEPVPGHLTLLEFDELGRHHYSVSATSPENAQMGPSEEGPT